MKKSWMVLLVLLLSSDLFAAAPVSLSVSFEPAHTIPGVPVQIVYKVRNLTDREITVPSTISLAVRSEGKEPFMAKWEGRQTVFPLPEADNPLVLKPNEERIIVDPLESRLSGPACFADRRLSMPGRYSVTVVMGEERSPSTDPREIPRSGEGNPEDTTMQFETVLSNEAQLIVEEPSGDEAIIWGRLMKLTNNDGWGAFDWMKQGGPIAEEIWREFPSSKYAQHVAYMVSTPREFRIQHLKAAIELDPKSVLADYLRLLVAGATTSEMGQAMLRQSRDVPKAMAFRKESEELLRSLVNSRNTAVRLSARELLREFPSESQLRVRIKELN